MKTLPAQRTPFEVKAVDDTKRTFTGLASAYSLDLGMDIIHPGAFLTTLAEWKQSGRVIPLLDQHNSYDSVNRVVGKLLDAKETADGLECTFEMVSDDPDADAVYRRIKGGYVTALSIGYKAVRYEYEEAEDGNPWDRIRHLHELKLREVSVVIFPMQEDAQIDIASVKSQLAGMKREDLSDDDRSELRALASRIGALLRPTDPAAPEKAAPQEEEPAALAPDDPKRLEVEELLRDLEIRSLT